jgi:threonine/homoserine/homoserine lactone efflux protein
MLSFLSPDGEIGAPLQAAAFLITLFLAVFVSLCLVSGLASRHGLARCARALVRTPSLTIAALLALTALNLVHHAVMPLTGVFRPDLPGCGQPFIADRLR